jgi:hypothetical protein
VAEEQSATEEAGQPPADSTEPEPVAEARVRRWRSLRRLFFVGLCLFLGLGLLEVYGVRTSETSATGGGYELTVSYATVSRPGLATPWSAEIRRPGGFDGPVTVTTTSDYIEAFDENSLDPEPSSATTDADRIIWEFDPPPEGDTLTISLDARIEPSVQLQRVTGVTEVLEQDEPVVSVRYRTWVMP